MPFYTFLLGVLLTMLFMVITIETDNTKWVNKNDVIVKTVDNGIICRENSDYPKLNCLLIKEAIGPKKVEWKFETEND